MRTFLLAWNSKRWDWDNLQEMSESVRAGKKVIDRWSCGLSKRLQVGDRVFVIRLGEQPRGIFASGIVTKKPYEAEHWDSEKASIGEKCFYVTVQFDTLLNPDTAPILPREALSSPPFAEMHWDTQMSGVEIPTEIAEQLEKFWATYASGNAVWIPEEVENDPAIFEGALRRISVNAYERNPEARRKCILHYGTTCSICGFDFSNRYGVAGKDLIHVHHLRQLAEIGKEYQIDPIRDLRPVCPNCHAIIHRRNPSYTIEEVQTFLRDSTAR
jgi:5-methylcytosine-specific restriction protein A